MRQHSTSFLFLISTFWRHRSLIVQLARRDVAGRYRGSLFGLAWSFLHPLLMLGVYTFVFSVVFNARWGTNPTGTYEFAVIAFSGMIVHGFFAECVNRGPNTVLANIGYVKRVVFPLEILPWVTLGSALFHAAVSLVVLLAAYLLLRGYLNWTAILVPLAVLPTALLAMGLGWFLAATGVYLRDLGQITNVVTVMMLFMAPVFYPTTALPEEFRIWLHINPLTFPIEQAREVLIWGGLPDFHGIALHTVLSAVVAWLGFFWFQKARKGFADVL